MNKKDIRLDLITIDAGTQQRPLDEDTLSRYMNLMADGVEFPPIELVSDGVNFWLWDGFHRYRCVQERGQKSISAYITKGTLRDAIWLSFSANKDHGLPRTKGAAKGIIEKILTDSSWSKKSLTVIAHHVGVTKQFVSKVKEEFAAIGQPVDPCAPKTGDSEPKTQAHGATTCTIDENKPGLQRGKEIMVTRKGTTYTQRSQEKQYKAGEPPKDGAGRVIPEPLRDVYEGRKVIEGFISDLAQLRDGVVKHLDTRDPAFFLLNTTAFQANYENLRRTLKSAMPYAVCPYCGGEDSKKCRACQGFGLLNKDAYEAAPKELRL